MEENKLELNEKLYSFEGVIGRYGYLLNLVIICAISTIVMLPYSLYIYSHAQDMTQLFGGGKVFMTIPLWLQILSLLGTVGVCTLSLSNIYRRLNDITGRENVNLNVSLMTLSAFAAFSFLLFPLWITSLFGLFSFVLNLILLFKKGKITSIMPYDFRKGFNLGAFFGTWIWGLFNNSYIPLWYLLLKFTPLGFHFCLYCGLKGNEWAYKNKGYEDLDKFKKSQETQAIVFTILYLVFWPFLITGLIILIVALIVFVGFSSAVKDVPQKEPVAIESVKEQEPAPESRLDKVMNGIVSLYFEKYEITEDENKFYVSPKGWKGAGFRDKKEILDMAATTAANERRKKVKQKESGNKEYFSKTSELPRTKIYSSDTNQLLAEFDMDESKMSGSFTQIIKAVLKAYKFYNIEDKE